MNTGGLPGWPIYLPIFGWGDLRKVESIWRCYNCSPPPLQKSGSVTEHPGRAGPISRRGNQVPLKDGVVGATPGCSPFQKIQLPENKRSGGQGVPDVAASVPYTGVYGIYGLKKKNLEVGRNSSKIVVSV